MLKIPTKEENAGMNWWNDMEEGHRDSALELAKQAGHEDPSPFDAWEVFKKQEMLSNTQEQFKKAVQVTLELEPAKAEALAQFVKRVTWLEMRCCAVDDKEAFEIRGAIETLQNSLADSGYSPR